jgi:hypothetical protein
MKNTDDTRRAARRGLDQLQGRADGVGGGVHEARDQAVDLIQGQHHGRDHHGSSSCCSAIGALRFLLLRKSTIGST